MPKPQRVRRRAALVAATAIMTVLTGASCVAAVQGIQPSGPASARPAAPVAARGAAPSLQVSGNKLVDAAGRTVVLHGVNRSGPEFACHPKGWAGTVFHGPSDERSVRAIASWKGVNAVRIPLNEDCWLGLVGSDPRVSGPTYRNAIQTYVRLLHKHRLVAILDLHWTRGVDRGFGVQCADATAACQKPMPDAAHAPAFWSSVATAFKGDLATVFDLFNEPFPDAARGMSKPEAWRCWQLGGANCPGFGFEVAGMQQLLNAVRGTGARNVVMLGGLAWSSDLTLWLAHRPTDPTGNLAASWHLYNFNGCDRPCWEYNVTAVSAVVPVITGEIGQDDCKHDFVDELMTWLDERDASYLAWTWSTYADCRKAPILIKDDKGTPTTFGKGIKDHFARFGG